MTQHNYGEDYIGYTNANQQQVNPEYKEYLGNLHAIAGAPAGQSVLMAILERLGTFDAAWVANNAQMAKATVLRDFGQSLMDDLAIAHGEAHDHIHKTMRVRRSGAATYAIFSTKE